VKNEKTTLNDRLFTAKYLFSKNIYPLKDFLTSSIHDNLIIMEQFYWDQVIDTKMSTLIKSFFKGTSDSLRDIIMNIEWDYNYYQPWSDNEWLVDEILAILDEDIIMQ